MINLAIRRALRRLHEIRDYDPIPSELRGWSWDRPPVKPRAYLGLGVSEIAFASECGFKSLWLRRRGVRIDVGEPARVGLVIHEIFHMASSDLRSLLPRLSPWDAVEVLLRRAQSRVSRLSKERWAVNLYKALITSWAGEASSAKLYYGSPGLGFLPWLAEYKVDGSPLGLSKNIRVDAIAEAGVVVEVKYGKPSNWHYLSLAGYALALESFYEVPVDYGVLLTVSINNGEPVVSVEPVYVSAEYRRRFLEVRDDAIDVLLSNTEPPEVECRVNTP